MREKDQNKNLLQSIVNDLNILNKDIKKGLIKDSTLKNVS